MPEGEQIVAIEKPGEGNMNVVLRIRTDQRSFILKQSRPYVQKYQQIEAPLHRIAVEYNFYGVIEGDALAAHVPNIYGYEAADHLLMLEDLGQCEDMVAIYRNRKIDQGQLERLIFILGLIHQKEAPEDFPENLGMRRLNHQHIFVLPFMPDNGFQLDDVQAGLQELSLPYKNDSALKTVVDGVGNKYLSPGDTLLHGDYYPGSWMTEHDNIYVIDPEFGFVGFAEFDLGVMAAHLIISTADERYLHTIERKYPGSIDQKLMGQVAGIEIMRRLIGLAQLPLERTISEKDYLLRTARKMIMGQTDT